MKRFLPPILRAGIHLAMLSVSVLLLAHLLGWLPDFRDPLLARRQVLCESLAIHSSLAAQSGDIRTLRAVAEAIARRNPEILSIAVRGEDGNTVFASADHAAHWKPPANGRSTLAHVQVPITCDNGPWGTVEVCFRPAALPAPFSFVDSGLFRLMIFVVVVGSLVYTLYLRTMLRDSSAGIPERVRRTLNTLVEGVLVVNRQQKIALANKAFAAAVGRSPSELEGHDTSEFPWSPVDDDSRTEQYPWSRAIQLGATDTGTMLGLATTDKGERTFLINAAPIEGDDGTCRGAIATFDDVTNLRKNEERLRQALGKLRRSREKIRLQNEELQEAAMRDPLTSCLNRRAFLNTFESHWGSAVRHGRPLSCLMIDIDRFKSINDRFGHQVGDEVLRAVAATLQSKVGSQGFVARYGGEEFCVLLPGVSVEEACRLAEELRARVMTQTTSEVSVTISLGASALSLGACKLNELVDQADQALYAAKRSGRNRVVRWDDLPEETVSAFAEDSDPAQGGGPFDDGGISFRAVASLLSALAYRHADSAEHSRRVAELAVATGRGLLSHRESYILEIGALLHDIGKIGVPDAILLKPGPLAPEEWDVMEAHELIGDEITLAVFGCQELTEIVRDCHTWYGGSPDQLELPRGEDIPLGARILSIADAYDAMVSDRVYRRAMTRENAFAELRRCAGTQFDPELVERFIGVVSSRDGGGPESGLAVPARIALKLGRQTERLADALDRHNVDEVAQMALCLKSTAAEHQISEIEDIAAQLQGCAELDRDMVGLVDLTVELLELCRSAQRTYLSQAIAEHVSNSDTATVGSGSGGEST